MIDHLKHTFATVSWQGVIKGGGQIQHDRGSSEHARADYRDCTTTPGRGQDEEWRCHESREAADPVAHAIRDLLSKRGYAFHRH